MSLDLFGNKVKKPKVKKNTPDENKINIYLWSGGKDSTCLIDKELRAGKRIDYIVFTDTTKEFPEMYDYINKVSKYWIIRYKVIYIHLYPQNDFDSIIFNVRGENGVACTNPNNKGKIAGLLNPTVGFCEWRNCSKITPFEKWIKCKAFKDDDYLLYLGFTIDESSRCKRGTNQRYPLIDIYRYREVDCSNYLKEYELENPLYRYFARTGCRLCPYQSPLDYYNIWRYFPEVWEEFKEYEKRVIEHPKKAISSHWFQNFKTTADKEEEFKKWYSLGFEPSDEPLKNCMCKV